METEDNKPRRGRPRLDRSALDPTSILDVSPDMSADVVLSPEALQTRTADIAPDPHTQPEEYAAYVSELRQKRKPYGAQMQKLAYPQRTGYKRHWFNDVGGRVQDYQDSGWTPVLDPKTGKPVSRTVGSSRDNTPLKAVLMEIPSVFWEEVEAERAAIAKARMDDIKKSPIRSEPGQAKASDRDKFYSPKEEMLSIRESTSRS